MIYPPNNLQAVFDVTLGFHRAQWFEVVRGDDALAQLTSSVAPLAKVEQIPLLQARGRVLASAIDASRESRLADAEGATAPGISQAHGPRGRGESGKQGAQPSPKGKAAVR